jgi:phage terminase small subunit
MDTIPEAPQSSLTPKQAAFCREYLVDLNATQAAIRAGYSERTARQAGAENLSKPDIRREIKRLIEERAERTEITAERVLRELAALALYDPGKLGAAMIKGPEDIEKLPDELRRGVVGWGWDRAGNFVLKLASKTQPLDLLGQHLGLWKSKVEITGPDGGPVALTGPQRPDSEAVAEWSAAFMEGWQGYLAETGEAVPFDGEAALKMAHLVGRMAAGEVFTLSAGKMGAGFAMSAAVRAKLIAETSRTD